MNTGTAQQQNASVFYTVSRSDLPASCPRPDENLSALHPRVVLKFGKDGTAVCPYCGALYELTDNSSCIICTSHILVGRKAEVDRV